MRRLPRTTRTPTALLGSAAALGLMAAYVALRKRQAERRNPPHGRFVEVDGVRLHYA